jgi:hypothetical protein
VILCHFTQALPFIQGFWPIALLVIGIFMLSEFMFWLEHEDMKKIKNIFWHTVWKKFQNIFEALLGLSAIAQVYILFRDVKINIDWSAVGKVIVSVSGWITIILSAFGVFYIWIMLNSLKYKRR